MYKLKYTNLSIFAYQKVQGLTNVFEMSVNMDIRILWKYEDGVIILLLDIGHHKDILGI